MIQLVFPESPFIQGLEGEVGGGGDFDSLFPLRFHVNPASYPCLRFIAFSVFCFFLFPNPRRTLKKTDFDAQANKCKIWIGPYDVKAIP